MCACSALVAVVFVSIIQICTRVVSPQLFSSEMRRWKIWHDTHRATLLIGPVSHLSVSHLFSGHHRQLPDLHPAAQESGEDRCHAGGAGTPTGRRPCGFSLPTRWDWRKDCWASLILTYTVYTITDYSLRHSGVDLVVAFYGCLYAGCVPITVRPPHHQNIATTLPTVKMIVEVIASILLSSFCSYYWNNTFFAT